MQVAIDENSANQRFDRFLRKYCKSYPEVKLSDIYMRIRKWAVMINNKKSKEKYKLQLGDVVQFRDKALLWERSPLLLLGNKKDKIATVNKERVKKMILFEDTHWLVFDKPAGVVLHGWNKHTADLTMNDYLAVVIGWEDIETSTFKPAFGYRLDKDTSGVLIAGKTYDALQYLNEIIRERKIDKQYMAWVLGTTPSHGEIDLRLEKGFDKTFGKSRVWVKKDWEWTAKTSFETVKTIKHKDLWELSLLKLKIYTGRMHQIRVHLAHIGYPLLWDLMYGNPAINRKMYKVLKINRQLLHCWRYGFEDPYLHKLVEFVAPVPKDFSI